MVLFFASVPFLCVEQGRETISTQLCFERLSSSI